jgi:hypothetical protein
VAHCRDFACTSADITTVDTAAEFGQYPSIAIGVDGLPLIVYAGQNYDLRVAHCSNVACTASTLSSLETISGSRTAQYTAITVGADGRGLIAYGHNFSTDLKVAHCENIQCSSATISWVDSHGYLTKSITIGADGLGVIAYLDTDSGNLRVAHCSNVACTASTIALLDDNTEVGFWPSITIGVDGRPLISYSGFDAGQLRVAHCVNINCAGTGDSITILDTPGLSNMYTGVTIGPDGLGIISYFDTATNGLKVAHCENVNCSRASLAVIDNSGDVGYYSSITIGADGMALISYYDNTNRDLKVAHLSNNHGTPNVRRR